MTRAVKLGTRFKRTLKLRDGHYEWNYWDPAGPWDVDPNNPANRRLLEELNFSVTAPGYTAPLTPGG